MYARPLCLCIFATWVAASVACTVVDAAPTSATAKPAALPSFAVVKRTVEDTLAADRKYRPGDLLSQGQVAKVLAQLKSAGWDVPNGGKLHGRIPADNELMVRALRSDKGMAFMREVAKIPDGFDRLDRLCRTPTGHATVERLIQGPGGSKLVEYLAETRGGQELGQMLAATTPDGQFNRHTGRIYNDKQLLLELQRVYSADVKRRQSK